MASCSEYGRERDRAIKHAFDHAVLNRHFYMMWAEPWGLNYYFSPRARYHWDVSKEYLRISVELEKAARGDPETVEKLLLSLGSLDLYTERRLRHG